MGEPIIVAQVLETPSVVESADIIYTTATNELQINGTGFAGAKDVSFTLTLRYTRRWAMRW